MGAAKTQAARRRSNGSRIVAGFYDEALTEAERAALPLAREIDGLDEEIAVAPAAVAVGAGGAPGEPEADGSRASICW